MNLNCGANYRPRQLVKDFWNIGVIPKRWYLVIIWHFGPLILSVHLRANGRPRVNTRWLCRNAYSLQSASRILSSLSLCHSVSLRDIG